jgi:hypothetical protein
MKTPGIMSQMNLLNLLLDTLSKVEREFNHYKLPKCLFKSDRKQLPLIPM